MRRLYVPLIAASAVVALASAAPALAAPPVLQSVGHVKRHPRATWVLPSDSEAAVAEVATSPEIDSDGYFSNGYLFGENVKASDLLEPGQTTWRGSNTLKPGTYYIHVASYTPSCIHCPLQWSQVQTLVIKNQKPWISRLGFRHTVRYVPSRGEYVIRYYATFRYCDDTSGSATAAVLERYWLADIVEEWAQHSHPFSARRGCSTRTVSWIEADRLFGVGWHTVRLQVRDQDGGLSNKRTLKGYVID